MWLNSMFISHEELYAFICTQSSILEEIVNQGLSSLLG